MEGKRRNKKKFSVLGCRIVLWGFFFFFYVRCELVIGGQKIPFHIQMSS
jgi:hypothetical protein